MDFPSSICLWHCHQPPTPISCLSLAWAEWLPPQLVRSPCQVSPAVWLTHRIYSWLLWWLAEKMQVWWDWFLRRSLSLACRWHFPMSSHASWLCGSVLGSSYKDTSHTGSGPTYRSTFHCGDLSNGLVSTWWHDEELGSGLQCVNTDSALDRAPARDFSSQ